jgi:hypothetical protein
MTSHVVSQDDTGAAYGEIVVKSKEMGSLNKEVVTWVSLTTRIKQSINIAAARVLYVYLALKEHGVCYNTGLPRNVQSSSKTTQYSPCYTSSASSFYAA